MKISDCIAKLGETPIFSTAPYSEGIANLVLFWQGRSDDQDDRSTIRSHSQHPLTLQERITCLTVGLLLLVPIVNLIALSILCRGDRLSVTTAPIIPVNEIATPKIEKTAINPNEKLRLELWAGGRQDPVAEFNKEPNWKLFLNIFKDDRFSLLFELLVKSEDQEELGALVEKNFEDYVFTERQEELCRGLLDECARLSRRAPYQAATLRGVIGRAFFKCSFAYTNFHDGIVEQEPRLEKNKMLAYPDLRSKATADFLVQYQKNIKQVRAWIEKNNAFLNEIDALNPDRSSLCTSFVPKEIREFKALTRLKLMSGSLIDLPDEIGELTALTHLNLIGNHFAELPSVVVQLKVLTDLDASMNQLKALPPEFANLTSLKELKLYENCFSELPSEIRHLANLEKLDISENQLKAIPDWIEELQSLKELVIRDNSELQELPLSLGNIPGLTTLSIKGTGISESQRDTILDACRSQRDDLGRVEFPYRLASWLALSDSKLDSKEILSLKGSEKRNLNEWLLRLERTRDYGGAQKKLANTVCGMLESLLTHQDFKELFFVQIEANNERCEDRAAMALNELYVSWRIFTLPEEATANERLPLMIGSSKTLSLRRILSQKIDAHKKQFETAEGESVEIYLCYETLLKEKLGLLTAIEEMAYRGVGKCDWIDQEELAKSVNDSYLEDLIRLPIFAKLIVKDDSYLNWKSENDKEYEKKEKELQSSLPTDLNEFSEESLEWQAMQFQLKLQKEKDESEFMLSYAKKLIETAI